MQSDLARPTYLVQVLYNLRRYDDTKMSSRHNRIRQPFVDMSNVRQAAAVDWQSSVLVNQGCQLISTRSINGMQAINRSADNNDVIALLNKLFSAATTPSHRSLQQYVRWSFRFFCLQCPTESVGHITARYSRFLIIIGYASKICDDAFESVSEP